MPMWPLTFFFGGGGGSDIKDSPEGFSVKAKNTLLSAPGESVHLQPDLTGVWVV